LLVLGGAAGLMTSEFAIEFDPVGFGKPLEDGMAVVRITPIGKAPDVKP
jgi:hypothetical protein